MPLTTEQRVEIILLSGRDGATNKNVAEQFNRNHPHENVSHTSVGRLINKFRETGSVLDKKRSGCLGLSAETRAQVLEKIASSPGKSMRRAAGEMGVPRSTILNILKAEKFHPYKLPILHKLYEDDSDRRLEMAVWFQVQLEEDPDFVRRNILFSDEANFYVSGEVNRQNCRYYSQDNPHFMLDSKEHSGPKIMVWCGLWRDHVLGPFFFNQTVTGERIYLNMLQNDLIPQFDLLGDGRPTWFMQDGAPPHYATIVCD